ncbi:MAG: glycosyltransferase family 4 protein [Nitrospiraceae bacterium]|nr:glycosyltransferase family 4 protein [Nitrospiraceae bacterium]
MNVAMFAEVSAERVIGGAERVLQNQAMGLQARGHEVTIVTRARHEQDADVCAVGRAREFRYQVNRQHELSFVASTVRRSVGAFDRATEGKRVDIGLIHQSLAGLGVLLQRPQRAAQWVYMCLSLAHEEFETRVAAGSSLDRQLRWAINARARRWIEGVVMRRCHRVVVLSEFMRRRVMDVHGIAAHRIDLIPGAVDLHRFAPPDSREAVRAELAWPADRQVLFTVRNLVPRMGLENLLDAVYRLKADHPRLLVLIGGEGPLREKLEELIQNYHLDQHVRLLGFVPEGLLQQYYQAADLVVMPTLQLEGFGLVTVEAMACGTPVLSTPVAALPEVVGRIDPALVAEGREGAALAQALDRMLRRFRQDPNERARLSAKGRRLVEQIYNWERHCEELERVLGGSPRALSLEAA